MKTIKLFNEDVKIAFNVLVQITYEQITGKGFDAMELNTTLNLTSLYYAVIIANNPETKITFDDLTTKATAQDIKTLRDATIDAMNDWSKLPDVMHEDIEPLAAEDIKNA